MKLEIPANAMKTVNHCPASVTGANVPYPMVVETVNTKYSEPVCGDGSDESAGRV